MCTNSKQIIGGQNDVREPLCTIQSQPTQLGGRSNFGGTNQREQFRDGNSPHYSAGRRYADRGSVEFRLGRDGRSTCTTRPQKDASGPIPTGRERKATREVLVAETLLSHGQFSTLILMQRFDMAVTPRSDSEPDDYRAATNLAIFYVALLLDRLVHQNTDGFTAIRTIDVRFQ